MNEIVIKYLDWTEVWAEIEPLTGREYFAAQQISSDISTRIRIRELDGVTKKMRVVYRKKNAIGGTYYYEIDSVLPVKESNREVYLMCRKIDSEGFRVDGSSG